MNSGWLAWEGIVFAVFVCASSFAPLWRRRKDASAPGGAKRAYIFAGGGVSTLSMILSVSRGTLGVRSFLEGATFYAQSYLLVVCTKAKPIEHRRDHYHFLHNSDKIRVDATVLPYSDDHPDSLAEIKRNVPGIDALIWNTKHQLNKEILNLAGPQLKVISTMSSGVDQVDVDEVRRRGLPLGNTPQVLDNAVADITVGLLIAAARRFKEAVEELVTGEWKYGVQWMIGQDIAGSTVGVVGLGGIGQAVVRRLRGFDVARFLYSGRSDKPEAKALGAERIPLEQLLRESDYVILSCPLTAETKNMINADSLKLMKRNCVLVNIARGGLVDQDALYDALKEKRIYAAGLDVVTPEPLPKDHKLVTLPNCYILPHMGSATIETRNAMAKISANNILLALEGKPMLFPAY